MTTIISVENLSKKYVIGRQRREKYTALRDVIASGVRGAVNRVLRSQSRRNAPGSEDFWALKDVSFDIQQGDRVGIIGRNGAGKSTLLKILSRITEPTAGKASIKGRVASLLEVGTGFHPELTGRENIFLNGAVLGMRRAEIGKKFDEIVAFANVEKFLDTPVKRYSSGMYVRLAFAVAAHLEPEILIVDEVLAVGDAQFQKKCIGKLEEVGSEGRTVLLVSHQMAAIQNLCRTGIVLDNGTVKYIGAQSDAVSHYLSLTLRDTGTLLTRRDRRGTQAVRVVSIVFVDHAGHEIKSAISGQELGIRLYFERCSDDDCPHVIVGIAVKTAFGLPVFLQHSRLGRQEFGRLPEQGFFELRISRLPLSPSTYRLTYSLISDGTYIDALSDAAELVVSEGDFFGSGEVPPSSHGVCLVDGAWSLQSMPASSVMTAG